MVNLRVKRTVRLPVKKSTLAHAAQLTLDLESAAESADISLVIGDDALLHSLNLKYRGVDAPTDVLSFPENEFDPDTHSLYLGDVVISLPRAEEQAARGGHTLEEELQLLVVHGTLHLLGFDHLQSSEKEKMQTAQDRTLKQLGVGLSIRL